MGPIPNQTVKLEYKTNVYVLNLGKPILISYETLGKMKWKCEGENTFVKNPPFWVGSC